MTSGYTNESASKLTFDQVQALWDDQAAFADRLVDKRKSLTTILAIVLGLGIVRLQLYRRADMVPVLDPIAGLFFGILLSVGVFCLLFGGYFLLTSRSLFRRKTGKWTSWTKRHAGWIWQKARAHSAEEADQIGPPEPLDDDRRSNRVLPEVLPNDEHLDDWIQQSPDEIWLMRAKRLRAAYRELAERNDEVALRLNHALFWIFLGVISTFSAIFAYVWAILF